LVWVSLAGNILASFHAPYHFEVLAHGYF
jgi:hypothetical protein